MNRLFRFLIAVTVVMPGALVLAQAPEYQIISLGIVGEANSGARAVSTSGEFATGFTDNSALLWQATAGSTVLTQTLNGGSLIVGRGLLNGALTAFAMVRIVIDSDGDDIKDASDNCTLLGNPQQRDTDNDGFGNTCDGDFNNDNIVNALDLGLLRVGFFGADPTLDMNGGGVVGTSDLGLLRFGFFQPPGPSGTL